MTVAYLDAFSGISGDMTVGALLALGVPLEHLREQLALVDLAGYEIRASTHTVQGIQAVKFDVDIDTAHTKHRRGAKAHGHRAFRDILAMIERSQLNPPIRDTALRVFTRLAEAEGRIHGVATDAVTFHEVGAVDSIVDIVSTAIGVAYLGIQSAHVSALPTGSGMVQSQHGPLPVPPPATAELLKGYTVRLGDGVGELVTPTGAAIVATLANPTPLPSLRVTAVGYGAGTRNLKDRPNLLRVILGETDLAFEHDQMVVIETNIDDTNPELYSFVFERLFAAGARDVYLTPIQMKKTRPGVLLRAIGETVDRERLAAVILTETSAIGVRTYLVDRLKLPRENVSVTTDYGEVTVKVSRGPGEHLNVAPEYDDCARIAREKNVPLKLIYQAAIANFSANKRRSTRSRPPK